MNDDAFEVWTDAFDCVHVSCLDCTWQHVFERGIVGLDDLNGVASTHDCS